MVDQVCDGEKSVGRDTQTVNSRSKKWSYKSGPSGEENQGRSSQQDHPVTHEQCSERALLHG